MIKFILAVILSFSAYAVTYLPASPEVSSREGNHYTSSATTAQDTALTFDLSDKTKYALRIQMAEATPAAFTIASTSGHIDTYYNRFYKESHGLVTGASVAITTSDTLPDGLTGAGFFASKIDNDFFYIMDTKAKAITGTPALVLTSVGTGVQTFTPSGSYRGTVAVEYSLNKSDWHNIVSYSSSLGTNITEDDSFNANWLRVAVQATQGQLFIKTDINVK